MTDFSDKWRQEEAERDKIIKEFFKKRTTATAPAPASTPNMDADKLKEMFTLTKEWLVSHDKAINHIAKMLSLHQKQIQTISRLVMQRETGMSPEELERYFAKLKKEKKNKSSVSNDKSS